MAISKEKKQQLVAGYVEVLQQAQGVIITEYRGMDMNQLTAVRARLRELDAQYTVTKNTLFKLALHEVGMAGPDDLLAGPVAASFVFGDLTGTIKALLDLAEDDQSHLVVKGGIIGESVFNAKELEQLTKLPSLNELQAQIVGLIATPATSIVTLLQEPARGVVGAVHAASTQLLNVIAAYAAKAEQEAA